jgi:hypothetical protein
MTEIRDEFLSEEDLDLRNLTWDELIAYWNLWLEQAQATNDLDADLYSHGVFERDPTGSAHGVEYLQEQGKGTSREKFDAALARLPDVKPEEHDEL